MQKVDLKQFLSLDKDVLRSQWQEEVQNRINNPGYYKDKFFSSILAEINSED